MSVICKSCGTELAEGVKFCRACGAKVEEQNAPVSIKTMFEAVISAPDEPAEKSAFSPASAFEDLPPEPENIVSPQPEPQPVPMAAAPVPQPAPIPMPVPAGQPEPSQPIPSAPSPVIQQAPQPVSAPQPLPVPQPELQQAEQEEDRPSTAAVAVLVIIIMLIVGVIVFDVLYLTGVIKLGKDAAAVAANTLPASKTEVSAFI